MSRKFAFDEAGVEALEPGDREWRAWDEVLKGFGVRIRPFGWKSWIVNATARGADGKLRSRRITLGRCGEMGLEEARAEARKHLGGEDLSVERAPAAGMDERAVGEDAPTPDDPEAADPVAGLATVLDGVRGAVNRIEARSARTGQQVERLSAAAADAAERRRRWRPAKMVLGLALAMAVGAAGGAAVQAQMTILPQADPTFGWRDHVWNHYGTAFMDCFDRAREEASGRATCEIEVRAR